MYVRNCLCAGDFLTVVPVGIPTTLQYNDKGLLEKVYQGYESDKVDISDAILATMFSAHTAPTKIAIQGGTTWVKGVLYTSELFYTPGELPDAICPELIQYYIDQPNTFNFFAGAVDSLATVFKGAAPIRNWLSMSKFHVLPGWLIPSTISRDAFINLIDTDQFTFRFPFIASYIIYRGGKVLYVPTHIKQFIVDRVTTHVDSNGYILGCIESLASEATTSSILNVSYSDIVKFNIQRKSLVVTDCYNNIIYTTFTDNKKRNPVSNNYTCATCGMIFRIPANGEVACPNARCMSKQYPNVVHLLRVLNLPEMDVDIYRDYVKQEKLTCVPDVLTLPEYQSVGLKLSLSQLLSAIVPIEVVANPTIFALLANKCNNNVDSFKYYITHPDMIQTDLKLSGTYSRKLIDWLSDNYNVMDVLALLDSPQITISEIDKRFEGAPIFRNKLIMITGVFAHGSNSDIAAIFRSYSAAVTDKFSTDVHCIVVGDALEDIDGVAIHNARALNIPIFSEHEFFNAYEIDKDLTANI